MYDDYERWNRLRNPRTYSTDADVIADRICDGDEFTPCHACGKPIDGSEHAYIDVAGDVNTLCSACGDSFVERLINEACEWARAHCKVTSPLSRYDPSKHHAPTHEEFEQGDIYAHTENAVSVRNRHRRTNYEQLLLEKCNGHKGEASFQNSIYERVWYNAIRATIDELLETEMARLETDTDLSGEEVDQDED